MTNPFRFNGKTLGDFSQEGHLKFVNLGLPFLKILNNSQFNEQINKKISETHLELSKKFQKLYMETEKFLIDTRKQYKQLDDKITAYNNDIRGQKGFIFDDFSTDIKLKFENLIENHALLLQDVCRLCLLIGGEEDKIDEVNLPVELYNVIKDKRYANDNDFLSHIANDRQRVAGLKEMRNMMGWHKDSKKGNNTRAYDFHQIEIKGIEQTPQIISFKPAIISIQGTSLGSIDLNTVTDDLLQFFDGFGHNIFSISKDLLLASYAYNQKIPLGILISLFGSYAIKDDK